MSRTVPFDQPSRPLQLVFTASTLSALSLGLLVIFGWLTGNHRIVQIRPEFSGMHVNTALCFAVSAVSLLLGTSERRRAVAASFAVFPALIGVSALLAQLTPLVWSPDRMFAGLLPALDLPHPARMAPVTAGSFAVAGLALASDVLARRRRAAFAVYAGGLLVAAGGTALAGYALGFRGLYGWAPFTPMAVHTAMGFLFLGIALTFRPPSSFDFERWSPGWLTIAGSTASFLLWQGLVQREHGQGFSHGILDLGVLLFGFAFSLLAGRSVRFAYQARGFSRELERRVDERTTELRASEERLRAAALFPEENPFPVLRAARDGSLLYSNPAAAALLEQWQSGGGRILPEFVQAAVRATLESGTPQELETDCGERNLSFVLMPIAERGYVNLYGSDVTERKRAQQGLAKAMQRISAHMDNSPLAVVEFDAEFRVVRWSDEAERLFGWAAEEILGRSIVEVRWVHDEDVESVRQMAADLFSGKRPRCLNVNRNYRKDGAVVHCEWYNSAIYDGRGRLASVLSQVLDVSERRHWEEALRASEERLNQAQAIAHLGSWELDFVRGCLTWSDEVFRIFGLEPQAFGATYEAFLEAVHPEDRAAVDAAYSGSLREGADSYEIEHRIVRKSDGEIRIVHEKCQHFRDQAGQMVRSIGMVQDVTERKQAEESLRTAKHAAEAANRSKSEFLARMSHELRTPLNGVIGMIDLSLTDGLPAQTREWLKISKNSAWSLVRIVDEILEYARMEAGRVQLEEQAVNLRSLLDLVVSTQMSTALRKGIRLTQVVAPDLPLRVVGDQTRLQQVLTNLVSNAVKFTETGAVTVTATPTPKGDAPVQGAARPRGDPQGRPEPNRSADRVRLLFTIQDTGIGIPAERLSSIFERFSEATAATHAKYGGSGLGLSIAKQLAELMGGRIWAESTPTAGSTFRFEVDLGLPEEAAAKVSIAPDQPAEVNAGRSVRVLLAEDNPVNQLFARELLRRLGHEAVAVSDGEEALRYLSRERFDVVMMDIQMPKLDGVAATESIRKGLVEGCPTDLPIIALTAHAMHGDRERFLAAGMDDYIAKPFDPASVEDVLRRALERSKAGVRDRGSSEGRSS